MCAGSSHAHDVLPAVHLAKKRMGCKGDLLPGQVAPFPQPRPPPAWPIQLRNRSSSCICNLFPPFQSLTTLTSPNPPLPQTPMSPVPLCRCSTICPFSPPLPLIPFRPHTHLPNSMATCPPHATPVPHLRLITPVSSCPCRQRLQENALASIASYPPACGPAAGVGTDTPTRYTSLTRTCIACPIVPL